jgi:hypothetical protein
MRAKQLLVSDEITKGQGWKSNQTDKAEQEDEED